MGSRATTMPVLGSLLFPALPVLRPTRTVAPMRAWRAEGEEASRTESSMQLMLGSLAWPLSARVKKVSTEHNRYQKHDTNSPFLYSFWLSKMLDKYTILIRFSRIYVWYYTY